MQAREYISLAKRTEKAPDYMHAEVTARKHRLLHAMLGIQTESGELGDAVKKHYVYNKDLDIDNVVEEVGDLLWYVAILCNELHFTLETAMELNIAKLRKRYPDQYSDADASARADKT